MVNILARPSNMFAPAPAIADWNSLPAVVSSFFKSSSNKGSKPFFFLSLFT